MSENKRVFLGTNITRLKVIVVALYQHWLQCLYHFLFWLRHITSLDSQYYYTHLNTPDSGPGLASLNLSQQLHTKLYFPKLYCRKNLECMQR